MPELNSQQFPMESLLGMHTFEHGSRVGDVIYAWRGEEGYGESSPADIHRTRTLSRSLARNGMREPVVVRQGRRGASTRLVFRSSSARPISGVAAGFCRTTVGQCRYGVFFPRPGARAGGRDRRGGSVVL